MDENSADICSFSENLLRLFCTRLRGPKIFTHSHGWWGWAGHPHPDIFQQAEDAAAPSRGGESHFWCSLVAPILVLQQVGGGELQLTWKRSSGEDEEARGWGGAAQTAEQRNGNLQWGQKVCTEEAATGTRKGAKWVSWGKMALGGK